MNKVINASGRMTILGVSTLSPEVLDGISYGGGHYFEMAKLYEQAGIAIAKRCRTENAMITNSASASIVLAIAGLITKDDPYAVEHLHKVSQHLPNEMIIMKGHNVDYGAPIETMVYLAGAKLKEVGYANGCSLTHLESAISNSTIGVLFVKSHHCVQKNMPSLEDVSAICKEKGIPLIVDAAAEEQIDGYSELADLIVFSGSKAIEGPSSGILAGKNKYIHYASLHRSYIGRAMKVGKETVFGLLAAIEQYGKKTLSGEDQKRILQQMDVLNNIPGVKVDVIQDEAGREIYRSRLFVNPSIAACSAMDVVQSLKAGEIPIYTRDYHANEGHIDIDPRPLLEGDIEYITMRLQEILGG
ncbi:DgaE family pyridoxal phosphate-dependent ammonia lyase [Fredinandcohnia quinoae]|uniref:DgaE family pyridoxal phosphate-dependent ammonia lyase n=1 Tax=Fredinandcohnia quinoae TaxID=2918902 RepID=A0AAW5E497_9BACI|nr:DgaE family pyridoxal phosphate-dependent ammonia lyase [Fredinandcohnia sp. SECRCQ15]MCH1627765.1 DgaE family pyridoxal phosphate-dependent ammonia lyase [Fredinandcohnia sp. SECRCQ15]